jgi:hypothetical protein
MLEADMQLSAIMIVATAALAAVPTVVRFENGAVGQSPPGWTATKIQDRPQWGA